MSIPNFLSSNTSYVLAGSALGAALLFNCYRSWAAGGVCRTVVDLSGKVVIVTGANTGIGYNTSRELARMGARVIMACRNEKLGNEAVSSIQRELQNNAKVEFMPLDLSSLKSIRSFAQSFRERQLPLHILVNNAGVMACPHMKTADGFELQLGTNHLGHFLLTNLLLDILKKSAPSRIVNLSSLASERNNAAIHWDDIMLEKPGAYAPWVAYRQSKLANVLFTRELSNRLAGSGVTTYSVHPGAVNTELARHLLNPIIAQLVIFVLGYLLPMKTPLQGTQTSLYCCIEPSIEEHSGKYFADCKVKHNVNPVAYDDDSARRLWVLSENLVKKDS